MLSIENKPAADSNEISLKGVDLSIPSLDDHNPIPKFSIRDYVFNARSKDIKKNWPFSQKNLQLCVKHEVKDILPPFQCLDCVKNRPSERNGVESSVTEEGKMVISAEKPPNKVAKIDNNGSVSCDKELLVTTNNHLPEKMLPNTPKKSDNHLPKKPVMSKPPSSKKCRLIVKVGHSGVEPSSKSNTFSNKMEPMAASKICPVCKIFSSSSNTKLNAHIDQCLSVESPIEPSSKTIVIKHRIKPRKTRLMVDIYETAPYCTIEELDRRNGRIWSEKASLPTVQEEEVYSDEEKNNKSVGFGEKGDEGAVYIDDNGTKIRILNKINDAPSESKLGANFHRLGKIVKGDKGNKPLSTNKKKKKHKKFFKLVSQREKTCSYRTRLASRVFGGQEKDGQVGESLTNDEKMDKNIAQCSKSRAMIPQWASSKGTNLLNKRFESEQSSSHESYLDRNHGQMVRNCYDVPFSSPKKNKEINNSSYENPNAYLEQPPLKKKAGLNSFGSQSSSCEFKSSNHGPFRAKNGHDYYENPLKHRGIDEDVAQVPTKRSSILKIKKKKSSSINSHGNEAFKDRFFDMEPAHGGNFVIGQSSGDHSENITSLAKSFDQDFYSISENDMEMETVPTDDIGNYFSGVDPITIPGPPGSFLPSPGRMSSDEDNHGISSLTTNEIKSSINNNSEMVDRDSSNSPRSTNSTIPNLLLARLDSKMTENLAPESHVIRDEIIKSTLGFQSGTYLNSAVFPNIESNVGSVSVKVPIRPPIFNGDFGSPSPSSPNAVLRLMGKNLVVVNNEENLDQNPNIKFRESDNHNVNQVTPICSYKRMDLDLHEYKPSFGGGLNRSLNNPFSPLGYNKSERAEAFSDPLQRKDVIVIDDTRENGIHTSGMNVNRTTSGGFPIPLAGYYNSGNLNSFYNYQRSDYSPYIDPHMIPNVGSRMPSPSLGPMRWNNVLEGSRMLPRNSLTSSPSTNHARPSLYYSPRMS